MVQATATKPAAEKTCSKCHNFNSYNNPFNQGWCNLFNLPAKTLHIQTNDCVLNSEVLRKEAEQAFPSEIIWTDREGYPMSDDPVANAYFDPNFVTYLGRPFLTLQLSRSL